MSNSLDNLLQQMRSGPVTQGWGAISVFSRGKLNRLLEQQYIERFQRMVFLPSFRGDVNLDDGLVDIVSLTHVELGAPLLSFQTASLSNSRAVLTMNIVAGHYSGLHHATGAPATMSSTFDISEAMGFKLELDIDLSMVEGEIDRQGKVTLNLAEGVNFRCNLAGSDESTNARLAGFFKDTFDELPADRSVFQLGMLELNGYSPLTPRSFRLLTQAAPGARVRGADNFGDGAVVVFIRLQGNTADGTFPPDASFPYLIPDDREADGSDRYSASLILSRSMLPHLNNYGLEVLGNLLFPGANAFKELTRDTPSDLAVFGAIAPTQTSYTLEPAFQTIMAGAQQRFVLRDWQGQEIAADTLSWQAVSLQSHTEAGHGTINSGLYTAPSGTVIGYDALHVIVTATSRAGATLYKASASLLVVFEPMQVAPRMTAVSGGIQARPVLLSASALTDDTVTWALREPQLGSLSEQGPHAVFTPDARSGKKALLAQHVEAQGAEQRVAAVLLTNGQQLLHIEPAHVPRLSQSGIATLTDDSTLLPGLARRWKVIAGGGRVDQIGHFTAPTEGVSASNVVSCEIVHNGVVFSSGYSLIEMSELHEAPPWENLNDFSVKIIGGANQSREGTLFPNGYQQLKVDIRVQTVPVDGQERKLSVEELASMRLADRSGQYVQTVPEVLEGMAENDDELWRVRSDPNRFQLAIQGGMAGEVQPLDNTVSDLTLYLHCRARPGQNETFHATFRADREGRMWTSKQLAGINAEITAKPQPIPQFDTEDYVFQPTRVVGDDTPTADPPPAGADDTPFDMVLRSVDYWALSLKPPGTPGFIAFETVQFLPEEEGIGGPYEVNTSMILWESEQLNETMFSWTGYIFDDLSNSDDAKMIEFDAAAKRLLLNVESTDIPVERKFLEQGKLVISLHRSDSVPYIREGSADRDKLSKGLVVLLIDKMGNAHKRHINFLAPGRVGRRNRLVHSQF